MLSASGRRDCYLEDFREGVDACSKNLVVGEHQETCYAVPRRGWQFVAWENCFNESAMADQCSFNIPAKLLRNSFGQTVAPLVALFEEINPGPVAMYSYAVDDDGFLIDPLPLEGAPLAWKSRGRLAGGAEPKRWWRSSSLSYIPCLYLSADTPSQLHLGVISANLECGRCSVHRTMQNLYGLRCRFCRTPDA